MIKLRIVVYFKYIATYKDSDPPPSESKANPYDQVLEVVTISAKS